VRHRDALKGCAGLARLVSLATTPRHDPTVLTVCSLARATVFEELVVRSASAAVVIVDDEAADVGATQKKKVRATAKEKCPSCGNPEMEYFTMQLRSADEGQTVFYECAKCGHTFSTNT
tara:strand:- start:142 stop:498 length:357 start_codon:yes stop_codon:yes gene_type:complete